MKHKKLDETKYRTMSKGEAHAMLKDRNDAKTLELLKQMDEGLLEPVYDSTKNRVIFQKKLGGD